MNSEVMVQVKARDQNPVQEWLKRVAEETGDPDRMETWGLMMQNENTKWLIVQYAKDWREAQRFLETHAMGSGHKGVA